MLAIENPLCRRSKPKARSGGIPRGGLPVGDGMFRIVVAVHGEKGAEDSKARIDDTRDASKNFVGGARNGIDLLFGRDLGVPRARQISLKLVLLRNWDGRQVGRT